MSIELMARVWVVQVTDSEQRILLCMADHGSEDGTNCRPGVELIAWKTGKSERQVQRIIRGLEQKGILVPTAYARGGHGKATEYWMNLDAAPQKPPFVRKNRKGDIAVSPLTDEATPKGDIVVSPLTDEATPKGDIAVSPLTDEAQNDHKRVTSRAKKGDIQGQKGDIQGQKGDIAMSPQPLLTIIEPLGEPLAATPLASSLTEEDFDRATQLWSRIREELLRHIPTEAVSQRKWLDEVELVPDPRAEGWCLITATTYQAELLNLRWRDRIADKAANLSRRRLPVSVIPRAAYLQMWGEDEAPAAEERVVEA